MNGVAQKRLIRSANGGSRPGELDAVLQQTLSRKERTVRTVDGTHTTAGEVSKSTTPSRHVSINSRPLMGHVIDTGDTAWAISKTFEESRR